MFIKNCDYISLLGDLFEIFIPYGKDIKRLDDKFSLPETKSSNHCGSFSGWNSPGWLTDTSCVTSGKRPHFFEPQFHYPPRWEVGLDTLWPLRSFSFWKSTSHGFECCEARSGSHSWARAIVRSRSGLLFSTSHFRLGSFIWFLTTLFIYNFLKIRAQWIFPAPLLCFCYMIYPFIPKGLY